MRKINALLFAAVAICALTGTAQAENSGPMHFDGSALTVHDVLGEVKVNVDPAAKGLTVTIEAKKDEYVLLSAKAENGGVTVSRARSPENRKGNWKYEDGDVLVTITIPTGGSIRIDDLIGKLEVGDLDGALSANIRSAADIRAGRLSQAHVDIAGAGSIHVGDIAGKLDLNIAGAGDVDVGTVRQGADIRVAGFGNVDVAGIQGPVSVTVGGVGDVTLKDGKVDRLDVTVSGVGSVSFDGEAAERHINSSGLASVHVNGKKVSG